MLAMILLNMDELPMVRFPLILRNLAWNYGTNSCAQILVKQSYTKWLSDKEVKNS